MERKYKNFAIILSLLICASGLNAATYYLDAANGNDSAAGSASAPWKSLGKAQATVASGDTVILRSGSYGNFSQTKAYTSFVTYKGDSSADPVLGNIALGSGSAYLRFEGLMVNGTANLYGGKYVELIDCFVRYPGDRYAAPANLVDIRYTDHSIVKGCDISHGKTGIKIDNAQNVLVSGNHIHDLAVDVLTATPVVNFVCEYNHAHDIHQDRFRGKDDYTSWPFIPASSSVSVDDRLYYPLKVTPDAGFTTGLLCYFNLKTPMTFQNISGANMSLSASGTLSSGDLAMRVSTGLNCSTSSTYVDMPISSSGTVDITPARTIGTIRSAGLVQKVDRGAITYTINDWTGSNGAHQDFVVFSNTTGTVVVRNNIFHDGCNQGIFTSPARGTNVTIENNIIYDMEGFNLTNVSLSGNNTIRNNTFIGYLRGPSYMDPFNKYHLNGNCIVVPLDSGSGIRVYNNIVGAELTSVGGYNDYNICTRQTTPGSHSLIISGTNPNRVNFDSGFFDKVNFRRYNGEVLDYIPVGASAAVNFGTTSGQPSGSLGTLDADGFVANNGPARDASHHSAGAHEPGTPPSGTGGGTTTPPPGNSAPVIAPIGDKSAAAGSQLSFKVSATDADSDPITYSATNLPSGASFSGQAFTWTPGATQAGLYTVVFTASDGKDTASQNVNITVTSSVPTTPEIAGLWHFDETSGTTAADSSGKGNTATLLDNPTWSAAGVSNGGLVFSGLTTAARVGMSKMSAQQGTIAVWAKPSGFTSTPNYLFGHSLADWTNRIQLYTNGTAGSLCLGLGGSHSTKLGIQTLAVNTWHHVVLTWNGSSYTVYVNGQPKATGTYSGLTTLGTNADFGNDGTSVHNESFNGTLDQARIYSYALTAEQVAQLYQPPVVEPTNRAPVLATIGSKTVAAGSSLAFNVSASDADGDQLTYSAINLPAGATFSGQAFAWSPSSTQAGTYNVTFAVSDGKSQDTETVAITVTASGGATGGPVFTPVSAKTIAERSLLTFTVSAKDPAGKPVTLAVKNPPTYSSFSSGTFNWRPAYDQQGVYNVTFTATSASGTSEMTVTITVVDLNRPPVLYAIGSKTVYAGSRLTFTVKANDPDRNTLKFTASPLPSGATFSSGSYGTFTWTPTTAQRGTYKVTCAVSDGQASDSEAVTIYVK